MSRCRGVGFIGKSSGCKEWTSCNGNRFTIRFEEKTVIKQRTIVKVK